MSKNPAHTASQLSALRRLLNIWTCYEVQEHGLCATKLICAVAETRQRVASVRTYGNQWAYCLAPRVTKFRHSLFSDWMAFQNPES